MNENIVITGGELSNKGAQSMTYTVIDQMKKRYPDKEIYLFSSIDYNRTEEEKNHYNFNFFPYNSWYSLDSIYPFLAPFIKTKKINKKSQFINILKNTAFVIDISGYHFTSQFGGKYAISYLTRIKVFKKYNIPIYIFPQSIGPFDFKFPYNLYIKAGIKSTMNYPEKIFARENHGFNLLSKYNLRNTEKNVDTVFYQDNLDISNIYKEEKFGLNLPEVKKNSVAIVPNSKLKRHNSGNSITRMYLSIINYLLEQDKNIYIFRHSFEDLDFCKEIYSLKNDSRVHIFEDDFNAIELYNLLPKFNYLIGSRYHSIVHAYKHNVPALVIGWAIKYQELTEAFNQSQYCFDIRNDIDIDRLIKSLDRLNTDYKKDKIKLENSLKSIKQYNVFDAINIDEK